MQKNVVAAKNKLQKRAGVFIRTMLRKPGFYTAALAAFLFVSVVPLSQGGNEKKVGVLVLAHGGNSQWNQEVLNAVEPLKEQYAVETAFGMADRSMIQAKIHQIEQQGVDKIIVVPLFISSYSPIIRQTEYLLGLRDTLADSPMLMHHASDSNHSSDHHAVATGGETADSGNHRSERHTDELKPVERNAEIILTRPLDDHLLVAEILVERMEEISEDPHHETVIIAAHGPDGEEDNRRWLHTMESLAIQVRAIQKERGQPFQHIFCVTLRDDAPADIYEQAKENLRSLVRQANQSGDVIIVPLLLSKGGIEKGVVKRLEGLPYKWTGNTLLPHPNITEFIQLSVKNHER